MVKPGVCLRRAREAVGTYSGPEKPAGYGYKRAARVRENEFDIRTTRSGIADNQTHQRPGCICEVLQRLSRDTGNQVAAAGGFNGVGIDNSLAPVEFIKDGNKSRIAQPFL